MPAQTDRVAVGAGVVGRPRGLRAGRFILRRGGRIGEASRGAQSGREGGGEEEARREGGQAATNEWTGLGKTEGGVEAICAVGSAGRGGRTAAGDPRKGGS
jgi:hypothetical protein